MYILFPHSSEISELTDITWRQAKISPSNAIIKPECSWEYPRVNLYGSVLKIDESYEMFYQCANALRLARATSTDGIDWHKELVTETDFSSEVDGLKIQPLGRQKNDSDVSSNADDLTKTNIVAACHMPSVMYQDHDSRPYKMFAFGRQGYASYDSVDGKQFSTIKDPVIELDIFHNEFTDKNWVSDVAPCFLDGDKYVAMAKTYIVDSEKKTRRCVGRIDSPDFETWSPVETIWQPGDDEDAIAVSRGFHWADFYGLCPFKYGDGYLGFLWLFEIEKELSKGTHQGKIEVFLASSFDGLTWERLSDEALIPWDLNFGNAGGMVTTASAPLFEESGIKLYYSDSNFEHGYQEKEGNKRVEKPTWDIRCAEIPKERLVGAYSDQGKILVFTGSLEKKMLRLNANTEAGELVIRYRVAGEVLGEQVVEGLDDTDIYIEPLNSEANELELCLRNVMLYAIEVI